MHTLTTPPTPQLGNVMYVSHNNILLLKIIIFAVYCALVVVVTSSEQQTINGHIYTVQIIALVKFVLQGTEKLIFAHSQKKIVRKNVVFVTAKQEHVYNVILLVVPHNFILYVLHVAVKAVFVPDRVKNKSIVMHICLKGWNDYHQDIGWMDMKLKDYGII